MLRAPLARENALPIDQTETVRQPNTMSAIYIFPHMRAVQQRAAEHTVAIRRTE